MGEDGRKIESNYVSRFQYGILLSLGGMFLVYFQDRIGGAPLRALIVAIGYLLTIAGFVVAGSGMAHYWRNLAAREKNDEE